jgi:hypothetical protein
MNRWARIRNWWRGLDGHHRISLGFDFVIAVATTTYVIVASCQLHSMSATLKQTKTLAEQSVRQANASKQSADAEVATVRAWVTTDQHKLVYPDPSKPLYGPIFSVNLTNVGKTPAINVEMTKEFVFDDHDSDHLFLKCPTGYKQTAPFLLADGSMLFSDGVKDLPKEQFARLSGFGSNAIYVHGCIRYHDVVGDAQRLTEFCLRFYAETVATLCHGNNAMK